MKIRGLWLPLLLIVIFWAVVIGAAVEKIDDYNYTVTKEITNPFNLKKQKDLLNNLRQDIVNDQNHIATLENQIIELEKEIKDAESAGVKDKLVTEM